MMPDARDFPLGRIVLPDQMDSALPLEFTEVHAQLTGPIASVAVTQRFGNPLHEPAELEYLFPLAEGAALVDFCVRIGARAVRGKIDELEHACLDYEDARREGRLAGLLEQRRPNLCAVQLANLGPGETVVAEIRYQERMKFSEEGFEFVFPMGITPKYDRPGHPNEGAGVHAPVARPGEAVGKVELNVSIDAGFRCGEPASPTHLLDVRRLDERRLAVRLAGEHIPDRDFVLRIPVAGINPAAVGWSSPAPEGETNFFLVTILPPHLESLAEPTSREFIFVLDRSGSMSGEPILQARNALRACLRSLNPGDTFNVLFFDDRMEWYRQGTVEVTQDEIDRVDAFLGGVEARGGTDIISALTQSLSLKPDSRRKRFVVFLTDGAVSAEESALRALRQKLGDARVFTFGIGSSVNRALLSRMARLGRGVSEFLQADEDIEGALIRFQDRVSFPALTDLSLSWEGGDAWDIHPARLPDLYLGQPIELCGKFRLKSEKMRLILRGKRGAEEFESSVFLYSPSRAPGQSDLAIARVWAKTRIEHLLEEIELDPRKYDSLRTAVIGLALEYQLVTPYTAFAALDETPGLKGGEPVRVRVTHPLPQGLDFGMIPGPGRPQPLMLSSIPPVANQPFAPAARAMRDAKGGMGKLKRLAAAAPASLADGTHQAVEKARPLADREQALRLLARTQRLDGSWEEDVELTAAGLLAFTRTGHTATAGNFRQVVRRALRWLESHTGSGFTAFLRARALRELAARSGDGQIARLAESALSGLPQPISVMERAAAGQPLWNGLDQAVDMDALRLAGLEGVKVKVSAALAADPRAAAWLALVL